jgi:hypothetical protein
MQLNLFEVFLIKINKNLAKSEKFSSFADSGKMKNDDKNFAKLTEVLFLSGETFNHVLL